MNLEPDSRSENLTNTEDHVTTIIKDTSRETISVVAVIHDNAKMKKCKKN